jgi:hypothetical protein
MVACVFYYLTHEWNPGVDVSLHHQFGSVQCFVTEPAQMETQRPIWRHERSTDQLGVLVYDVTRSGS